MTSDEALMRLGASTSSAVVDALEAIVPGRVAAGEVSVVAEGADPLAGVPVPSLVAEVGHADGVTGATVLLLGPAAVRRLAAAVRGEDPDATPGDGTLAPDLLEVVRAAVGRVLAATSAATSEVLGEHVEPAAPTLRLADHRDDLPDAVDSSGRAATVAFDLLGERALLVQLVPHSLIVRVARAYDELTQKYASAPLGAALGEVRVRVWAELGRARMPAGAAVGLPPGAVVELDRDVEDPIDLYADGMRVATGRLVVDDDGGLALRIEEVLRDGRAPSAGAALRPPTEAGSA